MKKTTGQESWETGYQDLIRRILDRGERIGDRTGHGTLTLFPESLNVGQVSWDRFPLMTIREISPMAPIAEMLWFLKGKTNIKWLNDRGVRIWDPWADEDGNIGPVYGKQWRKWSPAPRFGFVDQISKLIWSLKNDPYSRRHIVSSWNPGVLDQMALPPCHFAFQCHVGGGDTLHMNVYQRSADVPIGVPFNVAGYAALLLLLAREAGLEPGRLSFAYGNAHVYLNQVNKVKKILGRDPVDSPRLKLLSENKGIFDLDVDDFVVENYSPWSRVRIPVNF